jgi:hypothetical protein
MRSNPPASARADAHFPLRLEQVPALVAELCPGEVVNFRSVYRWIKSGRRGIRLETLPGIRKRTTRAMVERFFARLAALDSQPAPPAADASLKREQKRKHRTLAAAGR